VTNLQDSVVYDGWQRAHLALTTAVRDSMDFDRTGNVKVPGGAETYDVVSDRLLTRTAGSHRWRYVYDRQGDAITAVDSTTSALYWGYQYDALGRVRCTGDINTTHSAE